MKINWLLLFMTIALILVVCGVVLANETVELPRWILSSSGSNSAGGNVTVQAALGQPVVGVTSGLDITLGQGFWHGDEMSETGNDIYMPIIRS